MNRMKIVAVTKEPIRKNPHGMDARQVYDTDHATAAVITLQPGEAKPGDSKAECHPGGLDGALCDGKEQKEI